MELLVSPNNINDINKLIDLNINSFLFGIKDYSLYQSFYITIDNLKNIITNYPKLNIFISLNKLMHNSDIPLLETILEQLNDLNIKGILYDDLAILKIVEEKKLKLNLFFAGTHTVTNYHTINTLNIKGALLSSEITVKEILDIKTNTKKEIIVPIFGYQIMTSSYRKFITNYLNYCKLKKEDISYFINENNNYYPIFESDNKTHILTKDILNGINEIDIFNNNNIDYLYLNSLNISSKTFLKIVEIYKNKLDNKKIDTKEIDLLCPNNSTLFFYKESYFKMVNYE